MRETLFLLFAAGAMTLSFSAGAQQTEEFKPSGKLFGLLFADFHNTSTGGENVNVFQVTRSYFGYDYGFSKTFSSRIMFDATTQTVGGKVLMSGYLRNAYLQFDHGKVTIRGGLIGAEQISMAEKFWGYRYISKPVLDNTGMASSTDLGILVKYKPAEILTLDMSVVNGRGYKDIAPDTTLKLLTGFTLTPAKNILFRGYYDMMGRGDSRQWTASFSGAYIDKNFTLGAEYFMQNNHLIAKGENYSGINIFTAVKFAEKYSFFARYYKVGSVIVSGDTEPWNIGKDGSNLIVGFDYSPAKGIRISPNFNGFIPRDKNAVFERTIGLNVEARF
ncbi:MAG TPA: hypothetical protein VMV74_01060 [Bacteroidales bacterium]|nr:hypothetical protein [Bacteroidales bacterium]